MHAKTGGGGGGGGGGEGDKKRGKIDVTCFMLVIAFVNILQGNS